MEISFSYSHAHTFLCSQDETRLKCTSVNVASLDYKQESKRLIAEIKKLRML